MPAHMQTQENAQKFATEKRASTGILTEDYFINRLDTAEKLFKLKIEQKKLSRTESRDSKK